MKAVVFAYHDIGCRGLEALLRHDIDVAAVFTHRDDANEKIWFESVAELASQRGIPVFAPPDVNHPLWEARIRGLRPDAIFSFYFRSILSANLLAIPSLGAFNLHGSLLPKYRGRCPVNWAILNGERETGITLHEMVEQPDAGAIVAQRAVPIDALDTAGSVFAKLGDAATALLEEAIPAIRDGTAPRLPQDESRATTFGGRRPADGEIAWDEPAARVVDLVRAVAKPFPGAFTFAGQRKVFVWEARAEDRSGSDSSADPGCVLDLDPLRIACGDGRALVVLRGEIDGNVCASGPQVAAELGLSTGARLGPNVAQSIRATRKTRVLILGVNGFIGSALSESLLQRGGFDIYGMDMTSDRVESLRGQSGFHFREGDISVHREWIEYHIRKCDVVLPLVAIATPIEYVRNPLRVFELDFEENLRIVRHCVKHGKRVIFPSTSEVYGMCDEAQFDEDNSRLILGPIRMQRWIYSCSKQLLDRVIWAYGAQQDLQFTLFRPFNWIGPRLDSLDAARIGSSRAITQLIHNLVEGLPIQLVDGGGQKRCFTDVEDGVECLARLIENERDNCNGQIVNIGNPQNEASIRELAEMLVSAFDQHRLRDHFPPFAGFRDIESESYYGQGYQDVEHRRPCIRNARRLVDWVPTRPMRDSVVRTLDHFLLEHVRQRPDPEVVVTPAGRRDLSAAARETAPG